MVVSCYEAKRAKLRETKEMYVSFYLERRLSLTYRPSLEHTDAFHKWMEETFHQFHFDVFQWTEVAGGEETGIGGCQWPR